MKIYSMIRLTDRMICSDQPFSKNLGIYSCLRRLFQACRTSWAYQRASSYVGDATAMFLEK